MFPTQLKPLDAAYYFESELQPHLDRVGCWVFESDPERVPSPAEVTAYLRRRTPFLATLDRRIVRVPAYLDYPFWVTDHAPIEQRLVHRDHGLDWSEFLTAIGELAATAMDARSHAWRVHVFYGVRRVPGVEAAATIVVLQGSHALLAGPSIAAVASVLFGDPHEPVTVPGLGPAAERVNRFAAAARGLARTPAGLVRYAVALRAAVRAVKERQAEGSAELAPSRERALTPLNGRCGDRRTARVVRLDVDALKRKNLTLTSVLLTGISLALQRYLDEDGGGCPPDLAALVTIAMTAAPTDLGVNRLAGAVVDLHPEIESLPARAATVQASLERERRINSNDAAVERIRLVNQLPSVLYPWLSRQGRRRGRAAQAHGIARLHTVVSSINFGGAAPWSLAGAPLAFAAAFPPLTFEAGLTHCFIGAGHQSTLSILTSPDVMPRADRYVLLLEDAFAEITGSLVPR
ncbi:wax ester/triacylglycerol synthase domain-containing protein [Rhodococcus sp. SJ]|uniref:wax ester/triacylglycerol synthase domain-containing protein n=1 Tax=Rhodococcus sp. SJ TaxID=3434112 RepID=UPI003D79C515